MTTITEADIERTRLETLQHIHEVRWLMCLAAVQIINRGHAHDASKLVEPELSGFAALKVRLADVEYGTPAYRQALADAREVVQHHYRVSDHHPDHFPNGIRDMNLLQILEMVADWASASKRTKDGSIWKSLEVNRDRFNLSSDLVMVLANTIKALELDSFDSAPVSP